VAIDASDMPADATGQRFRYTTADLIMLARLDQALAECGPFRSQRSHHYSSRVEPGEIVCDEHGLAQEAFLCRHLLTGTGLGFEEGDEVPGEGREAWCHECERYRVSHGGWSDEVPPPAGTALVCEHCYGRIKALNEHRDIANPS
jgi:hypothetical protein